MSPEIVDIVYTSAIEARGLGGGLFVFFLVIVVMLFKEGGGLSFGKRKSNAWVRHEAEQRYKDRERRRTEAKP